MRSVVASADLFRAPPSNPEYRSLKSHILNGESSGVEWYIACENSLETAIKKAKELVYNLIEAV